MAENPCVLVVDDNSSDLNFLVLFFQQRGFTVFPARNAPEALEVLKNNPVGLVVTDLQMGGQENDGDYLAASVQKYDRDIPIVIYTSAPKRKHNLYRNYMRDILNAPNPDAIIFGDKNSFNLEDSIQAAYAALNRKSPLLG